MLLAAKYRVVFPSHDNAYALVTIKEENQEQSSLRSSQGSSFDLANEPRPPPEECSILARMLPKNAKETVLLNRTEKAHPAILTGCSQSKAENAKANDICISH